MIAKKIVLKNWKIKKIKILTEKIGEYWFKIKN